METNKEHLIQKAKEFYTTQKFVIAQANGAKAEFTPISGCNVPLPVNRTAPAILEGFIQFLFAEKEAMDKLLDDFKTPPNNA